MLRAGSFVHTRGVRRLQGFARPLLSRPPCRRLTLDFSPERCKPVQMRRTVDLDADLEIELTDVVSLTREKPAVVIRQALRTGLPAVASRFQSPRPAGYFAGDYGSDQERLALESAMGHVHQKPER